MRGGLRGGGNYRKYEGSKQEGMVVQNGRKRIIKLFKCQTSIFTRFVYTYGVSSSQEYQHLHRTQKQSSQKC